MVLKKNNKFIYTSNMKLKISLLILLSALCVFNMSAQKKNNKKITITGTVTDASNLPIMNAMILIDDEKTNSVTDSKGEYSVKVKPTASRISIFTFGSGTFEDSINGRTRIDFKFGVVSAQKQTDEVLPDGQRGVSTGYGTIKKRNLTNETGSIDGTNKKYASYRNLEDMITHEIAGVRVSGGEVNIQNSKNLWGPVMALIVVDGVYMDALPEIPPVNVKSIEVLKGTAAAIYGSRGSGGVIVIKTKLQAE
jgi:TonB-dependent starch-binding outer membrane protein SusC